MTVTSCVGATLKWPPVSSTRPVAPRGAGVASKSSASSDVGRCWVNRPHMPRWWHTGVQGRSAGATLAPVSAAAWTLEPDVLFLNHGSFGACPRAVLDAQRAWRDRLEAQPVRFLARELEPALDRARAALGAFVGADPDDLAFVPNATHGVNTVLRSLRFAPGDELLTDDHEYNASANALRAAADRDGATFVVARVPFPSRGPDEVLAALLAAVTPRTRLVLVSHVTSPTALIFPVAEAAAALAGTRRRGPGGWGARAGHGAARYPLTWRGGRDVLHGQRPQMVMRAEGQRLPVGAPRPPGRHQAAGHLPRGQLAPPRSPRFRLEFDWTGTADPTAYLAIPAAIETMGALLPGGWPALMAANHAAAVAGRRIIVERLGERFPAPAAMLGSMASILLPDGGRGPAGRGRSPLDDDPVQAELRERWRIEVPIQPWPPAWADGRPAAATDGRLLRSPPRPTWRRGPGPRWRRRWPRCSECPSPLVVEGRATRARMRRLGRQVGHGVLQVGQEELAEVRAETVADDDAQHGDVADIGRQGIGGDLPAPAAQLARQVEDVVGDARIAEAEGEDGDGAARQGLERAKAVDVLRPCAGPCPWQACWTWR